MDENNEHYTFSIHIIYVFFTQHTFRFPFPCKIVFSRRKKSVNFFAQDTCNDDIMASLHKHKMTAHDSMLGSEINSLQFS